MKNNILKLKSGFTLIETLVAISILTAAIAGPLVMSIKNIGTANTSQDQLIAFYLGQEAIEYVRNVRDTNLIGKDLNAVTFDWLEGLDKCTTGICSIDVFKKIDEADSIISCAGTCVYLKIDGSKKYGHNGGDSSFTRTIKITKIDSTNDEVDNPDEAQVDVEMKWKSKYGNKTKTMNLQDHIFNWRE